MLRFISLFVVFGLWACGESVDITTPSKTFDASWGSQQLTAMNGGLGCNLVHAAHFREDYSIVLEMGCRDESSVQTQYQSRKITLDASMKTKLSKILKELRLGDLDAYYPPDSTIQDFPYISYNFYEKDTSFATIISSYRPRSLPSLLRELNEFLSLTGFFDGLRGVLE